MKIFCKFSIGKRNYAMTNQKTTESYYIVTIKNKKILTDGLMRIKSPQKQAEMKKYLVRPNTYNVDFSNLERYYDLVEKRLNYLYPGHFSDEKKGRPKHTPILKIISKYKRVYGEKIPNIFYNNCIICR